MRLFLALVLLSAGAALAQEEMGLDLSEEKPPAAPPELRPVLGVLSVKAADAEDQSAARARLVEAELLKQTSAGEQFQTVIEPSVARQILGAGFQKAEACGDFACLADTARSLKAHRLLRLTVEKAGAGSVVRLFAWDPTREAVINLSVDSAEKAERTFAGLGGKSQAAKDREFMKKVIPFLAQALTELSTPLGKIVIDNADQSAIVLLDGDDVGVGSLEQVVQPGPHKVKVTAAGYQAFNESVSVGPLETKEVKVTLIANPIDEKPVVAPVVVEDKPLYAKPGLYLAIAGAAAVVTGVILGQSAQGVKNKLDTTDVPVPVTRTEAKAAETNALLANILVGAGSAAVVGGVTWIIVTIPPPPPSAVVKPGGDENESVVVPTGAQISFGGSF